MCIRFPLRLKIKELVFKIYLKGDKSLSPTDPFVTWKVKKIVSCDKSSSSTDPFIYWKIFFVFVDQYIITRRSTMVPIMVILCLWITPGENQGGNIKFLYLFCLLLRLIVTLLCNFLVSRTLISYYFERDLFLRFFLWIQQVKGGNDHRCGG